MEMLKLENIIGVRHKTLLKPEYSWPDKPCENFTE
jgi:hypothetical protein